MKLRFTCSVTKQLVLATLLVMFANPVKADGIPEPGLIIYGVVNNLATGGTRLSYGTLTWVFQPTVGGPAITLSATLKIGRAACRGRWSTSAARGCGMS